MSTTEDKCVECQELWYLDTSSKCTTKPIENCAVYQITNTAQPRCLKCKRDDDQNSADYGLQHDGLRCIDNAYDKGGTPKCFRYTAADATVCETCNDDVLPNDKTYALVHNEEDRRYKCQKLQYCHSATLRFKDANTRVYKCTKCAPYKVQGNDKK